MVRRAPGGRQPAVEDDEEIEQGSSQPQETVKVKSEKKSKGKGKGKSRREREGDDGDVDEEQDAANREDQEDIAMAREIVSFQFHQIHHTIELLSLETSSRFFVSKYL